MLFLRRSLFFGEQTFRKWFVSSMIVIIIFIVFGLLLYLVALYATERAVIVAQRQSAEQTKNLIDLKLLDIQKDVSALTFNEKLISASFIERPLTGVDYYAFHKAGAELRGLYLYGNISDIYVYYKSCNCYTSSYSVIMDNKDDFTELHFNMTEEEWRDFAGSQLTSSFVKIGDFVYFFNPLKRNGADEIGSLAIVELDLDELREVLLGKQNDSWTSTSYSYIVTSSDELIATTGKEKHIPFSYDELNEGENFLDNRVVTMQQMETTGWQYISVVPINQYFKEIKSLRHILYAYLGICLILAVGIVYADTWRRYRPILTLKRNVLGNSSKEYYEQGLTVKNKDIFMSLQETIQGIVDNNSKLTSLLREKKDVILAQKYSKLIREHAKPDDHQDFFIEYFNMSFKQGIVVIVSLNEAGKKLGDLSIQEQENILLICLNNISKELLGESCSSLFWKYVDLTGVIWTEKLNSSEFESKLAHTLQETQASIKQYFDVELRFSISEVHDGGDSITSAYLQAQETSDYAAMTGKAGVTHYEHSYTQPHPEWNRVDIIRAEQDFMSYMMEHNYEKAKSKLEIIIGYYAFTDGISIQLLKCRMFGLINLVLNAIEMRKTSAEEQFYMDMNPVQRLLNASTIQSLEKEIMGIIEAMILHYEENDVSTEKKLEYVDRYIESHYMDPALSVQQLADIYQLSVSYLSKVYKQSRKTGVLEAINFCRIRHAKQLLVQKPEMSIAQIAEQVGYGNVQTIMRIFKKLEKQTPGQYRARELGKLNDTN